MNSKVQDKCKTYSLFAVMKESPIKNYDLVICGAGPAGTSAAMALEQSGLKIALLDKYDFPRDKICGDFVAAKGIRELVKIKPELKSVIENYPQKATNKSTRLYVGELDPLQIDWVLTSYTIKREEFDNLLLQEVLNAAKVDFYPKHAVKKVENSNGAVQLETSSGNHFSAKMVIGADGAHSQVAKSLAGYKIDRDHYGGSVRAYYTNVTDIEEAVNEVYVHKNVVPGYFWLFPVSATEANVGLGMHSTHITKNKVNLKKLFYEFIETSPELKSKLGGAKINGKLEGFGLPFYSQKYTVSGDRFLLCGDAASMIDPTNGEGIMPAIISGNMAAQHILKCFEENRFDAKFNQAYANELHGKYWKEMRMKAWLVRHFADKTNLLNAVAYICVKSPWLKKRLQKFL